MGTDKQSAGAAAVGRAMGTEDARPLGYWLALGPRATVQLDEVVTTDRLLPDGTTLSLSGVVTQVGARDEGARGRGAAATEMRPEEASDLRFRRSEA